MSLRSRRPVGLHGIPKRDGDGDRLLREQGQEETVVRGGGAALERGAGGLDGGLGDRGPGGEVGNAKSGLAEREVRVEEGVPGQNGERAGGVRGCGDRESWGSGARVTVGVGCEGDEDGD